MSQSSSINPFHTARLLSEFFDDDDLLVPSSSIWLNTKQNSDKSQLVKNYPRVDVIESDQKFTMKCDLPGFTPSSVKIELNGERNILFISGETTPLPQEEAKRYVKKERFDGKFKRGFRLDDNIDPEHIKASFDTNGVLTIELPKKEKRTPTTRNIQITSKL